VILVGAGPGDPELLTIKAAKAIQTADVVVYDRLVAPAIVDLAPPHAERLFVGKTRSLHSVPQDDIHALLIDRAARGLTVVRLKGGDPFIFGRGGEEVDAVEAAGFSVSVIPGVTAAIGGAAASLLPLTHRDHASAVTFVAGQCKGLSEQDWTGLSAPGRTLVVYMGVQDAGAIADKLMAEGRAPTTPVAVLENATRPDQRTIPATLKTLSSVMIRQAVASPALLVIGEAAALAHAPIPHRSPAFAE
jgi:uroporphyrin-III C-methyltransferase